MHCQAIVWLCTSLWAERDTNTLQQENDTNAVFRWETIHSWRRTNRGNSATEEKLNKLVTTDADCQSENLSLSPVTFPFHLPLNEQHSAQRSNCYMHGYARSQPFIIHKFSMICNYDNTNDEDLRGGRLMWP